MEVSAIPVAEVTVTGAATVTGADMVTAITVPLSSFAPVPVAGGTPTASESAGGDLVRSPLRAIDNKFQACRTTGTLFYCPTFHIRVTSELAGQPRDQLERIAAFDGCDLLIRKYRRLAQSLHMIAAGAVRKIGSEHDLRWRDDGGQG